MANLAKLAEVHMRVTKAEMAVESASRKYEPVYLRVQILQEGPIFIGDMIVTCPSCKSLHSNDAECPQGIAP